MDRVRSFCSGISIAISWSRPSVPQASRGWSDILTRLSARRISCKGRIAPKLPDGRHHLLCRSCRCGWPGSRISLRGCSTAPYVRRAGCVKSSTMASAPRPPEGARGHALNPRAGRTPKRGVCHAVVGWCVIVEPRLHAQHPCCVRWAGWRGLRRQDSTIRQRFPAQFRQIARDH
jgi:hypothetical protein